ncbi:DUF3108 domain-containing protein [Flavilitoribacter nigricans]|uniref:DUF3108 domain-containing protein n=1 Tax=Flavilitoribacter nigricans (strain ATCC 23147 / DSM 23189 / NBRC 102662 / NCIMB 1420 / SS-2) TaxID=1122177 RepID=A0A2D0NI27_FLAN2|nr:DUF3108 domain-containing protein [Flavilitoribacter nigricans]PHN08036.1 hypothetical protein CRP01_03200 [Flavilitoribacter nigricans DSM 23189 = NBRC 102662]
MKTLNKTLVMTMCLPLFMAFAPSTSIKAPNSNTEFTAPVDLRLEACTMENNTFKGGEEITYKLYYNWNFVWLSAGEVTFRVRDLGDQYHISAVGRTYKSYEWFYKVRDYYDTYVDKETLLPSISIRNIHEGGYRLYDKVTFDRDRNVAVGLRGKTRAEAKVTEYKIDNCIHDMLSIVYYSRNIDFDKLNSGAEFPIKIFLDKETYPLKVKYFGTEDRKKVKGQGRFQTHVFSPQLIAGDVFKEDDQMKVWVSADQNKVPMLIESPVSVGSVKAVLKSYKGLKYEFDADALDE